MVDYIRAEDLVTIGLAGKNPTDAETAATLQEAYDDMVRLGAPGPMGEGPETDRADLPEEIYCPFDCRGCGCHLSPPCSHCVDGHGQLPEPIGRCAAGLHDVYYEVGFCGQCHPERV